MSGRESGQGQAARPLRLVYLTPSLYIAGGVERVLTLKANYFADHFGYDVTIVLTDGKDKPFFYPLSERVKVVQLDIGFEQLWQLSFLRKIPVYLRKQRQYKRRLTDLLTSLRPDITISLLRREINFLCSIRDGSRKIGELHVNRANYRNFEANDANWLKRLFAGWWMHSLVGHLRRLDRFVVLTREDAAAWTELENVEVIPDPLSFSPGAVSTLSRQRVVAVGRYVYQKGFDLLLQAWARLQQQFPEWELAVFGAGNREPYERLMQQLGIDGRRCHLNGPSDDIRAEYLDSGLLAFSSRFEGFGMVIVEAMACGLPVVSFACPCGPKDIISDGEDGLLAEPGNVDQLASKLAAVMGSRQLAQRLAAGARQKALEYEMPVLAEKWRTLFETMHEPTV